MITRNLEKAKQAFKTKNVKSMIAAHNEDRGEEIHSLEQGKYLKSAIYGGLDGIVTTFAVVAGVAGAALSPTIILILGFANLIADGISMAIGDYSSTKAEIEYYDLERKRESWEVKNYPEGEKKEMIEIYMNKGISKKDATSVVNKLSKYPEAWIDIMMAEELGLSKPEGKEPIKNSMVTFVSFAIFGVIPLTAYVLSRFIPYFSQNTFLIASIATGVALFGLGAAKVKVTKGNWIKEGFGMLIVGGIAAFVAYAIGYLISLIV